MADGAAAEAQPGHIQLKVKDQQGSEVQFKIKKTTPLRKLMDAYCSRLGLQASQVRFMVDGERIAPDDTAEKLGLEDEDLIDVAMEQGFVPKEDITEVLKAILAAQRDHGNRDVRANARMKYLVHTLGIEKFTRLVESYTGKEIAPWAPMADWKYADWMGWWEQGDGKLFYGQHVDNGRVKDEGDFRLKSAIRAVMDKYNLHAIMSPTQSIIFRDIDPKDREGIDAIFREHGVAPIEEVDPNARLSMACPALPLCGLAQGEAERIMPSFIERMRVLLDKMNLPGEEILMRITGCPNGCARPYMAELAFVGDGAKTYQLWLGGSPVLTRTAYPFVAKVNRDKIEEVIEPILAMFIQQRMEFEAFGDFTYRVGSEAIEKYSETYVPGSVTA